MTNIVPLAEHRCCARILSKHRVVGWKAQEKGAYP